MLQEVCGPACLLLQDHIFFSLYLNCITRLSIVSCRCWYWRTGNRKRSSPPPITPGQLHCWCCCVCFIVGCLLCAFDCCCLCILLVVSWETSCAFTMFLLCAVCALVRYVYMVNMCVEQAILPYTEVRSMGGTGLNFLKYAVRYARIIWLLLYIDYTVMHWLLYYQGFVVHLWQISSMDRSNIVVYILKSGKSQVLYAYTDCTYIHSVYSFTLYKQSSFPVVLLVH
jgi:hypothetical protein